MTRIYHTPVLPATGVGRLVERAVLAALATVAALSVFGIGRDLAGMVGSVHPQTVTEQLAVIDHKRAAGL